jgi:hypothetical protein
LNFSKVQICYIRGEVTLVELGEVLRDSKFELLPQVSRELAGRAVPADEILSEIVEFQIAWKAGETLQNLAARYRFEKVHDAECARRGILLCEIYVQRRNYRAVIAWNSAAGPGYWVSVFKKQGDAQSRTKLRAAGERAIRQWRK